MEIFRGQRTLPVVHTTVPVSVILEREYGSLTLVKVIRLQFRAIFFSDLHNLLLTLLLY